MKGVCQKSDIGFKTYDFTGTRASPVLSLFSHTPTKERHRSKTATFPCENGPGLSTTVRPSFVRDKAS